MSAQNQGPYTLTIASGDTDSPALSSLLSAGQMKMLLGNAVKITIQAPAAVTGTISPQVTGTEGGSTWSVVQINGTAITIPAATTNIFPLGGVRDLRIHSSGAEGASRAFVINVQDDLGSPS